MSSEYWKGVLNTARERLDILRARRDELDAEREEVNLEIVQVEQVVANLTPLVSEARLEVPKVAMRVAGLSLADACRKVLESINRHMTPIEVRNTLEASGYDLKQHNNALASIHGVLKRLAESGEAETVTLNEKGTMYRGKSTGVAYPPQSAGGGIGSLRTGVAPEASKISVPPAPKVATEESTEPALGDSLRKAAGLPPLRRRSALQEMAEKAAKKDEGESARERLIRDVTKDEK